MQRTVRRVVPAVLVSVLLSIVATAVARRIFGRRMTARRRCPATELPVFDSAEGRAQVERAYRAVLDLWPVPYVEREVPTSFGVTHVIECGPPGAPAGRVASRVLRDCGSVVSHGGPLSRRHRVYAVDIIGDANLKRPVRPVMSLDDYHLVHRAARWPRGDTLVPGRQLVRWIPRDAFRDPAAEAVTKLALIGPGSTFRGMPAF